MSGPAFPWRLVSIITIVLLVQTVPVWFPTNDAVAYYSIAQTIAREGKLECLGENSLWFPIGYPLILSLSFHLPFDREMSVCALHWALSLCYCVGVYRWASELSPRWGELIAGLCLCNIGFGIHYRRTLSEIAFCAVGIWAGWFLHRTLRTNKDKFWASTCDVIAAASLVTLTCLIRYAGVTLIAGYCLAVTRQMFVSGHDFKKTVLTSLVVVLIPVAGVALSLRYEKGQAMRSGLPTYFDYFQKKTDDLAANVAESAWLRASSVGQAVLPGMFKSPARLSDKIPINSILYFSVCSLVAIGWLMLMRDHNDCLASTVPFYLLLHLVYAYDDGARFMVPAQPILFLCLLLALDKLTIHAQRIGQLLIFCHILASIVFFFSEETKLANEFRQLRIQMADCASVMPLEAGRQTLAYHADADAHVMLEHLLDERIWTLPQVQAEPPDYVRFILTSEKSLPFTGFEEVWHFQENRLFKKIDR